MPMSSKHFILEMKSQLTVDPEWWYLARENRRRRNGERDWWVAGKSKEEIAKLGDRRYVCKAVQLRHLFKRGQQLTYYISRPDFLYQT